MSEIPIIPITQLYEILICCYASDEDNVALDLINDALKSGDLRANGYKGKKSTIKKIPKTYWAQHGLDETKFNDPYTSASNVHTRDRNGSALNTKKGSNSWRKIIFFKENVVEMFRSDKWHFCTIRGSVNSCAAFWYARKPRTDFQKPFYFDTADENFPTQLTLCQTLTWIAYGMIMDVDRYNCANESLILGYMTPHDYDLKMIETEKAFLNQLRGGHILAYGIKGDEKLSRAE